MVKVIEIRYEDNDEQLSFSQPKTSYSREALIKRLEEYEKRMLR